MAIAIHTMRSTMHNTLKMTPGAIIFNRDMLHNIPFKADLIALQERRQVVIDKNLHRMNSKRISFDYQPNQQVLIREDKPDKLDARFTGPYRIDRVHTNGSVTIEVRLHVFKRMNIRRIKPYRH